MVIEKETEMTYTIHQELLDGTIESAFATVASKRRAILIAKACASASMAGDVTRIIVDDAKSQTIATFPVKTST